ncbi:MAG: DUF2273 domain-containing protein [Halanaerobiaceae bacterium]|jgi:uncharacterized membrane protein|nr:DUF2273 domain-containing protein [Halanaerobiaceae bacterium]
MENDFWKQLSEIFKKHKGKTVGTFLGLFLAILILLLGFWKTILIALCTLAGYYIGTRLDIEGDFRKLLDKLLPPHFKK